MSVNERPRRYWRRSQISKNEGSAQDQGSARHHAGAKSTAERGKGLCVRWSYVVGCLGVGVLLGFLAEIYSVRQASLGNEPNLGKKSGRENQSSRERAGDLSRDGLSPATSYHAQLAAEGQGGGGSGLAFAQTPAGSASDQITGIPQSSMPDYPAAGKYAGLYNDGQAAFWDLPLIDFFKFFGPEQRAQGYRPEQPINFSHIVHVQQNKMECQYCHWSVAKASYAALPDVETCMGCHKLVKGRDEQSQTEIKKLEEFYSKGEAIPWVKVHVMPNHYKFNHKRHVKSGVACHDCHGQVGEMPVVERVSSMKMGWCVSCHREKGTSIDCTTCHH